MNNFLARVIILLIFFPLLFLVIFILPFFHHLVFNIIITVVATIGAFEVRNMFVKKGMPSLRVAGPVLAATLPAAVFLEEIGVLPAGTFPIWLTAVFGAFVLQSIFVAKEEKLKERLPLLASSLVVVVIPALFLSYIVKITSFIHPQIALIYLILPVFLNDIFAYLAGKLSRGWSRLNLVISPNKSLIGFVAGLIASAGAVLALSLFLPDYYAITPAAALLLGAITGLTAIVGDLFESALKRSCSIKDSGVLMGGRGGIMDAIDSLLLTAPVFFILFPLLAVPVRP